MGIKLATETFDPRWAKRLSKPARIIFAQMAFTALDNGTDEIPAGRFWAGHDFLMIGLDGDIPDRNSAAYQSRKRAIKRYVQELTAAGAVELVRPAARGRQAVYQVHARPKEPTR